MKGLLLLLLFILLTACIQPNNNRLLSASEDATDDDTNVEASTEIYWSNAQTTSTSLILAEDNLNVSELRGGAVNYFLHDDDNFYTTTGSPQLYCLVINFNYSGAKKQIRLRAVPINYPTISGIIKYFRIDVPEAEINAQTCDGSVTQTITILGNSIQNTVATSADIAYSLDDLCPTCSGEIKALSLDLYRTSGSISDATKVATTNLDLSALDFRVNTTITTSGPVNSCTNSQCIAQGYDCCLEGQCVNDGALRENASSELDYDQALLEVGTNPLNYILWPNIFYVCGNTPPITPSPTATPDAQATAEAYLQEQITDYYCLQGAKLDPADYSQCGPANDYDSYIAIRNDVWDRCGCEADPDNPVPFDPESACPDFGLKPVYGSDETTIVEIICDVPQPNVGPTPFSDTSTAISSRMAPHRFFSSSGTAYDDLQSLVGTTIEQEGTAFSYDDPINHTEPVNGTFNINSILGPMKVDLSGSFPAKVINVDFEHPYIISAMSGSYLTPCSGCLPDAWNSLFHAFPPTSNGVGLSAVGHTTSRVLSGTNSSHGNYEDTIFGRACWVPPTMIPFSHSTNSSVKTQRQNRLATQAAFYINGYQRDWYGFNKGAIIGSFDGVTWFAIGKGRRVVSTSTKLFLAINAPFTDLAETSNTTVTIIADNGYNGGTAYDYDPSLEPNANTQNQGASCQRYHLCEKDIDCVTQLGWEYTCSDVSKFRSHWPRFDLNANEIAGTQITSAKFTNNDEIIKVFPYTAGTKRCVYRGAGAPCIRNDHSSFNSATQKLFTCAPNFYCAEVASSSFNSDLIRTPNQIEGILFGQEANILGRPTKYINASETLDTNIQSNIIANAANMGIDASDIGICRPGKSLASAAHSSQHDSADTTYLRTDYISQISSCNSSDTDITRVWSCPLINMNTEDEDNFGNYIYPTTSNYSTSYKYPLLNQNSCGASSYYNGNSTFASIEADPLISIGELSSPKVARDACLRRAGSPCHTNYDCGPNELHANTALFFDIDYFGNTLAEKDYWSQELICGQGASEPHIYADNYYDYDLTQNRCCRAVGKDFTMYTQGYDQVLNEVEYATENAALDVTAFPSVEDGSGNPRRDNEGRYSRYEVVAPLYSSKPTNMSLPRAQSPIVKAQTVPYAYQWKTINDTARKTCCGSGWVRKFADGTHDWSIRNRNIFVLSSFRCLNYSTNLAYVDSSDLPAGIDPDNYERDQERLCFSPVDEDDTDLIPGGQIENINHIEGGGCVHAEMKSVEDFEIAYPTDYTPPQKVWMDTFPYTDDATKTLLPVLFPEVPYAPLPYDSEHNYFQAGKPFLSFYLPGYLDKATISNIKFLVWSDNQLAGMPTLMDPEGGDDTYAITTTSSDKTTSGACPSDWTTGARANGDYCIEEINGYTIFKTYYSLAGIQTIAGIRIEFTPYTTNHGSTVASGGKLTNTLGMNPGNVMFYQTKLARFELLGIPQIFYEPLYCNDDKDKLVPDIFDPDLTDKTTFEGSGHSYRYLTTNGASRDYLAQIYDEDTTFAAASTDNSDQYVTTQEDVALTKIFMPNDFTCCRELGSIVNSASECCSNYAVASTDGTLSCKLARGTDLNVYFNRFVSGDGVGDEQPGGGFSDEDFIPETGEIKLTRDTYDKLVQLGGAYCESGEVRTGGAFGNFYPNSSFYHYTGQFTGDDRLTKLSIVDEASDNDQTNPDQTRGYNDFQIGFRWNHHYYCD